MTSRFCRNCGERLIGEFCAQCGQSDTDYDVPIRDFAGAFLSESFDLDSRLRQTLWPLFLRPGEVAAEYVSGHRARYVPPIRLYIFASFAMFLVLSFTAGPAVIDVDGDEGGGAEVVAGPDSVAAAEDPATLAAAGSNPSEPDEEHGSLDERIGRGLARVTEDPQDFSNVLLNRIAQSMFLLLPAFALILKMAHPGRLYVHHLIFAIYLHSLAFLLITVAELTAATRIPGGELVGSLIVLGIPAHLVMGMRRFYGQRWSVTALKAALVTVAYGMTVAFTMLGLIALSVFLLGGG